MGVGLWLLLLGIVALVLKIVDGDRYIGSIRRVFVQDRPINGGWHAPHVQGGRPPAQGSPGL